MTASEKAQFKKIKGNSEAMKMPLAMLMMAPFTAKSSQERQEASDLLAYLTDPRGTYNFGDKFSVYASTCSNLLEYSIEANGQSWIWKLR